MTTQELRVTVNNTLDQWKIATEAKDGGRIEAAMQLVQPLALALIARELGELCMLLAHAPAALPSASSLGHEAGRQQGEDERRARTS